MPERKLDKNAPDKVVTPEQAIVNASVAQASAMMEIAECLNDIAANLETMMELEAKRAMKEEIITPVEYDEITGDTDEPEEN